MLRRCIVLREVELVKSFQLAMVAESLKRPHDLLFARFLSSNSVAFFSWPGLSHEECAEAMLAMPTEMRTCHTVFGRSNTPIHLALDVDCPVPPQFHTVDKAKAFRRETVTRVVERLDKHIAGTGHRIQRQLVLLSPNLKKCSVHVHVTLEGCFFANYLALAHYLQPLTKELPEMDMNIFRNNGSLRCFHNRKVDGTSELVPFDEVDGVNINTAGLSPQEMMQLSFIVANLDSAEAKQATVINTNSTLPIRAAPLPDSTPQRQQPVFYPASPKQVLERVPTLLEGLPESYATEYRQWIGVGLQLKLLGRELTRAIHGADSREIDLFLLKCWDEFSRRVPTKYRPGICRQRWEGLRPNGPDSWRGPYGYFARRSNAKFAITEIVGPNDLNKESTPLQSSPVFAKPTHTVAHVAGPLPAPKPCEVSL